MRRFATLVRTLDQTTRTNDKVTALAGYFTDAPARDAAWALWVLSGRRVRRGVGTRALREWIAELGGWPQWLVEESYGVVGDLAETLALLHPQTNSAGPADGEPWPLHRVMEERIVPLGELDEGVRRTVIEESWVAFDSWQRFVFNKLITGAFRLGVGRRLCVRGLAEATGLDPLVLAHRLTGAWSPTVDDYNRIVASEDAETDPGRPYPFFLAHPVDPERPPGETLGDAGDWHAEWKWDGIRAQLLHRAEQVVIWSRGEELITPQFPELEALGAQLPTGTVLDGEVLAWGAQVLPFAQLQRRLNRRRVGARLRREVPVRFIAWDLLELGGRDLRTHPLEERRAMLRELVESLEDPAPTLRLSEAVVDAESGGVSWSELAALRDTARERGVEGLMLKRRGSPYRQGRPRGDWFKWKVDPLRIDAVLMYAQRGHGRRASLYSDYTFGVWQGQELVPVGKAYSGLTDAEIRKVDRWVRDHTLERFGPVRSVKPELVFELAFDGVRTSSRHRSGIALRFPRMARWRTDKGPDDADSLAAVRALLPQSER